MSKALTVPALSVVCTTREEAHQAGMQAYHAAWQIVANDRRCTVSVVEGEDDITIKQRGFLHAAVLPQIAEQVAVPIFDERGAPTGKSQRYTADAWKIYLKRIYLPDTFEMRRPMVVDKTTGQLRAAKRAVPVRVQHSTEDLGIKGYSKLIDNFIDHAVLHWNVQFVFRPSEREAVRYVAKPRAQKVRQEEVATA